MAQIKEVSISMNVSKLKLLRLSNRNQGNKPGKAEMSNILINKLSCYRKAYTTAKNNENYLWKSLLISKCSSDRHFVKQFRFIDSDTAEQL